MSISLRDFQQQCVVSLWNGLFQADPQLAVIPTGGGKTRIATALIDRCINNSGIKILFMVQKIELASQTERAFCEFLPKEKIGIYCASLSRRELDQQVIISTIQSISRAQIEKFDLVIIDEVHNMDQEEGRYIDFYKSLLESNPKLKLIGLTATPYRSDGLIYGVDQLFPKITFKRTLSEMIRDQYLVPPVLKHGLNSFDTSKLHTTKGEYNQKELEELTEDARKIKLQINDALPRMSDRKCIVWACTFIKHAEAVAKELSERGENVSIVHSKLEGFKRETNLERFRSGIARHMVFVSALSEGFDHPPIECVVLMRPTRSPTLYVQTVGRGLRIQDGKTNCLVLDYGRVIENLGPLDNPRILGEKTSRKKSDESQMKFCPACLSYIVKQAKICPQCGLAFESEEFTKNLTKLPAEELELINEQHGYVRTYAVSECSLSIHVSKSGNKCLKLTYWPPNLLTSERPMAEFFVWNNIYSRSRGQSRLLKLGCKMQETLEKTCEQIPTRNPTEIKYVKEGKYSKIVELIFGKANRDSDSRLA